jgi:archaellum component FlaF (FlaF/FlaG flagellin family)
VLLFIIASVKAKLPSLERVCEKNKNVSPLNLYYDEVTATVNVSLIKNSDELFTSYKIYLFADWNHSTDKISCTDDAYLISHTAYDITAENVR